MFNNVKLNWNITCRSFKEMQISFFLWKKGQANVALQVCHEEKRISVCCVEQKHIWNFSREEKHF